MTCEEQSRGGFTVTLEGGQGWLWYRKRDGKAGSFAIFGVYFNGSSMRVNNSMGDPKSEAGSFRFGFGGKKGFEDGFSGFFRQSDSIVLNYKV